MDNAGRTRKYIIEKTAPIFNTKGYAGTSLSDLTQATGLTKGAIYGNFANKDEVALAAFKFNLEQITSGISRMMESASTPWEKLMVFPQFYKTVFRENNLVLGCPIVNTAPEADDTHPALCQAVNEAIGRWDKGIQQLVGQGIAAGEINKETDASNLASLMICLIEGGILLTKSTGNLKYFNAALKQVISMLQKSKA